MTQVEKISLRQLQGEGPKFIDVSKASEQQLANDPLLKKLKEWDCNGDGVFSTEEVMQAANDLLMTQASERHAKEVARRLGFTMLGIGFLLLLSIAGTFVCTLLALQIMKDSKVPQTSGVMLTNPSDGTVKPVSTSKVTEVRQGLSGLKESSKEELDRLNEVTFFHGYAYHRLKVSQIHRYDGRVEVWGCPTGFLIVEDTGEVHFSAYSTASVASDACWGENYTLNSSDVCGDAVDSKPPRMLEVEDPVLQDPENAPAPSPVGNATAPAKTGRRLVAVGTDHKGEEIFRHVVEVETEASKHARRLSSRRRGGSRSRSSTSSSSRTGSVSTSPRRRSYGSVISGSDSSVLGDSRRRSTSVSPSPPPSVISPRPSYSPTPSMYESPSPSVDVYLLGGLDGSSRRRVVDYYGGTMDSRRRMVSSTDFTPMDVTTDGSVAYKVNDRAGTRSVTCDSSSTMSCVNDQCSCTENNAVLGWVIGLGVTISVTCLTAGLVMCRRKRS